MDFDELTWRDHPSNPLIEPPAPSWMIADPTVIDPAHSPDGEWRLFANSLLRIHHYRSPDGVKWRRTGTVCAGIRPFIFSHEGVWHLFHEKFISPRLSCVAVRRSEDLEKWSAARTVIKPSLPWHGRAVRTCGNPCLVNWNGEFLLFYSAGTVWLRDCGFPEPRHIGVARGGSPEGPFTPDPEPVISPHPSHPYRNLSAGAVKVIPDADRGTLWGFNNGIYRDGRGRSRSAILLLKSPDGVTWNQALDDPIIQPGKGWKRALVYALDVKATPGGARIYYNARDGWFIGRERIGLALGEKPGRA
ncbi:MAG: glycosyl hydrolase family 43 [bacterium]